MYENNVCKPEDTAFWQTAIVAKTRKKELRFKIRNEYKKSSKNTDRALRGRSSSLVSASSCNKNVDVSLSRCFRLPRSGDGNLDGDEAFLLSAVGEAFFPGKRHKKLVETTLIRKASKKGMLVP